MTRRPRLQFPGAVYHVMSRGNRKNTIFHDALDYARFLYVVKCAVRLYDVRVFAFCLMPNHYHIVLDTPRGNLSDAMQYINGVFAQVSNKRYAQTGHVFGDRFRSLLIERDGYLKRATRYVVRNPVRAGMVGKAGQWPWSSYQATAGAEAPPHWLNVDWIHWAFKADGVEEARLRYVAYVDEPRRATEPRDPLKDVFGSARFKARIAATIQERKHERTVPHLLIPQARPSLESLFRETDGSRAKRDRAIHASRVQHGYRVAEIARFLKIHPSTVCRAVQRWA